VVLLTASLFLAAGPVLAQDVPEALENDQCVVCHADVGYLPDGIILDGPHMQRQLSCAGCHGGDNTSDDEEVAHSGSFRGVPDYTGIPSFCGKCHSDLNFMRGVVVLDVWKVTGH